MGRADVLKRRRRKDGDLPRRELYCVSEPHRKSAISYSGRISISLGPGMGLGQRFTQAPASSMSLTSEPEAGDQLAGFGERPVDDSAAGTIERNTLALRGGLEAVGGAQDAGIAKLVIKSAHRLHRLHRLGRGEKALFAVVGRLHQHHYTHRLSPC